ncbi:hypothetical protein [Algoriphagus boritolerans]|uniref:hypothetical protein n=1 Tax=Algoriphagus boritolerans TaxID=308111 RepID=UPI002FCE05F0
MGFVYGLCGLFWHRTHGIWHHDDYLQNTFGLNRITAGNLVLSFALMNIFARTLGGYFGDKFGKTSGLKGRVWFLAAIIVAEGLMLGLFFHSHYLGLRNILIDSL